MTNKLKTVLKRLSRPVVARLPVALPQSTPDMERFTTDVLELGGFDPENLSLRNAVVTQVLHIDMSKGSAAPRDFIHAIRRSIANQIAYDLMQGYKAKAAEVANETAKQSLN